MSSRVRINAVMVLTSEKEMLTNNRSRKWKSKFNKEREHVARSEFNKEIEISEDSQIILDSSPIHFMLE